MRTLVLVHIDERIDHLGIPDRMVAEAEAVFAIEVIPSRDPHVIPV